MKTCNGDKFWFNVHPSGPSKALHQEGSVTKLSAPHSLPQQGYKVAIVLPSQGKRVGDFPLPASAPRTV